MKRFLKFLCMCLIMSMAESAHAALPTVKDTVIISAADRKAVTLAEMAENFVDYDVVFFGKYCLSSSATAAKVPSFANFAAKKRGILLAKTGSLCAFANSTS